MLEESANPVVTPSVVIADRIRYPVVSLPRIVVSMLSYDDFEVTSLSVRLKFDPSYLTSE